MNMRRRGVGFQPDLQFHRRVRLAAVIAGLSAMLTMAPAPAQSTAARLRHLGGVDELKTWFNAGKGHPRLILLLSPT
jgi:hypothetical protein